MFLGIATRGIVAGPNHVDGHATDRRLLEAARRRHDGPEPGSGNAGAIARTRATTSRDVINTARPFCVRWAATAPASKVVLVPMRHEDGIHVVVGVASTLETRTLLRRTDGVWRDPVPERSVHQERPPLDVHQYTGVRNVTNLRLRWRRTHGLPARLKQADRQRTPVERLRAVLCGGRPSHRPAVRDRDGKYGSQQDACEHDRRLAPTAPARVDKRGGMVWLCQTCHPCLVAPSSPSSARSFWLRPPPRNPSDVVHLFNGKDLTNFYTWLVGDKRADPDKVFTVVPDVDGAPAIRISGQKYGGITTEKEYESYRLVVEFKWGTKTWAPRVERARDSGVLVHCQGPDGGTRADLNGPWMRSIEAQIIEGGVGDFLLVAGFEPGRHTPDARDDGAALGRP